MFINFECDKFRPECKNKTLGDRAFKIATPRIWNTLPKDITKLDNIIIFLRNHNY